MSFKLLRVLAVCFFYLLVNTTLSQQVPPIQVFNTENYGAENQNWAIAQASNKFIYVANSKGLLAYNGANWQLYTTPNETIMRSVNSYKDKIYTGFYMDFGYWEKNDFGSLEYTSIVKSKEIKMLEDEQIWEILEIDGWMLFKSFQRIYLYNLKNGSLQTISVKNRITKISKVEGVIYFQELHKGIFMIENGQPKLISDATVLKENKIVDIFFKEGKLLFLTQKKGFYFLNKNELTKWNIPANNFLSDKTIYSSKQLKNKGIVLGTISNGVAYLTPKGALNYQITQAEGLSNNTVLSIFEDIEGNIWLGLDNGINTINLSSPFKLFVTKSNFWGTIYTSIIYKDNLYLGTNQGLYYKKKEGKEDFKFIKNTQGQVWNLQLIDETLFCSHDSGTFIISKEHNATLIEATVGTWGVKKVDKNTLLQGTYNGLYVLTRKNNSWVLKNKIEGFSNSSRYFILKEDHKVFVNHEYKGVFKLEIDQNFEKVLKIKKDLSVEKGIHSSLVKYNNDILYSSKNGVYKYVEEKDAFKLDTTFSKLISGDKFLSAKLIGDKRGNKLWAFTKNDIRYLAPGKLSNHPDLVVIPVKGSFHKGVSGFENIIHLDDKKYLIGASNGYLQVDLNNIKEPNDFEVSINKIFNNKVDEPLGKVRLTKYSEFQNDNNNFQFFYCVPNYSKTSSIKFQYQLAGLKEKWSKLSKRNSIFLENLPSGDYTFRVRAVVDGKLSKNVSEYSFKVLKPWYLTNLMIGFYILILIFLGYVTNLFHRKYYKNQREKLLENSQREIALKELENSQKIIKLNNENLRNDIETKNRELATSTMNIIKKNEFLNAIKSELSVGKKDSVDKVIQIINKNLNNTNDWKMFQEAFNNADKNFLDKVKNRHPSLTPNDLKLCAYLRLNLSSKEIAPLLNISPRSVEVKRYRLRKKMDLPHDANLTSHILEI